MNKLRFISVILQIFSRSNVVLCQRLGIRVSGRQDVVVRFMEIFLRNAS